MGDGDFVWKRRANFRLEAAGELRKIPVPDHIRAPLLERYAPCASRDAPWQGRHFGQLDTDRCLLRDAYPAAGVFGNQASVWEATATSVPSWFVTSISALARLRTASTVLTR